MKFRSRSSRATGPKMRVPRGLFWLSMITAAFSSNEICVPSLRPYGFFVRTTTALTTSPFFTAPCGAAFLTVAVITSPTRAYRRFEPPITRMHRISRAPVLSATLSLDSCWITNVRPSCLARGLEHLGEAPVLCLRQRPRLDDPHQVADVRLVLGVVRVELGGATDHLLVTGVGLHRVDLDDDRLVHRIG